MIKIPNFKSQIINSRSFTLVDVLVGTFLILIVFLGIFGAFQLGLKVVGQNKNRITATSIANGEIEKIRNLPYESIGIQGGFPDGVLEAVSTLVLNNIEYTIERRVDFVADEADGLVSPEDECPNDYKKVQAKVSWGGNFQGEVKFTTNVAPKNLAQECAVGGGILSVSVFDAYGTMVSSPLIEIKDPTTDQTLKTATPTSGQHYFPLAAGTYKVVVSKTGFSSERTYGIEEIATPEKPHPIVLDGQLTQVSFSIDKVSSFSVDTLSPWGIDSFSDSFLDESKISESLDINVVNGEVTLLKVDNQYQTSGYLISVAIAPTSFVNWDKLSWTDSEITDTQILYQVLYFDGENWVLIPDIDLPGNSLGFGTSPVDLSNLDIATYSQLELKAILSTTDQSVSPILYDWQLSWITSEPTFIPNVTFHLQGEKTIGLDSDENPVYKYSSDHNSGASGHIDISSLEWDSYIFSIDPSTNLDLVDINPSPQPISLLPDTTVDVDLYLDSENSLLIIVQDGTTLDPIFSATVRLYNLTLSYDNTQYTDERGQTYFIPLDMDTYNLEIQAPGYSSVNTQIDISGDNTQIINLEKVE